MHAIKRRWPSSRGYTSGIQLPIIRFLGSAQARLLATTTSSDGEFPNDDFFSDVSDLFDNLNMGDAAATAAAAIQPTLYVIFNCLFRIMLEFFVLAFGVDVIGLSPIDVICSSTLLICIIGFSTVCMIMIYSLLFGLNHMDYCLYFQHSAAPPSLYI